MNSIDSLLSIWRPSFAILVSEKRKFKAYFADLIQHVLTLPSSALEIVMSWEGTVNVPHDHLFCWRFLVTKKIRM